MSTHEEVMARARASVIRRRADGAQPALSDDLNAEYQRHLDKWNRYVSSVLDRMLADLESRTPASR